MRLTPAQEATEAARQEALRRAENYRQASGLKVLPEEVDRLADWLEHEAPCIADHSAIAGYEYVKLARRILTGEWRE